MAKVVTTPNRDWCSPGGTKTKTFDNGRLVRETHTDRNGKTTEYKINRGITGPWVSKK